MENSAEKQKEVNIILIDEQLAEHEYIVSKSGRNKDECSEVEDDKMEEDIHTPLEEEEDSQEVNDHMEDDNSNMSVDDFGSEQTADVTNSEIRAYEFLTDLNEEFDRIRDQILVTLSDTEIEELVSEFLEVESRAAEAQESLEKETLAKVECEVRAELEETLHGDALEMAVSSEMETFREKWEATLDDLETQSAVLLEQLDGAGIELPSLYKWIESQVPNGCCTEAWKKRAHWVGSEVTSEFNQSVIDAESYLQSCQPVRRNRGKLLEEGASGYLAKKLSVEDGNSSVTNTEKDWSSFNELVQSRNCSESTSFGSRSWTAVYLASTPQQAANMGLKLPGVNEVEEIGEIDCDFGDPFYADALENEKRIDLSEEQKRNFRKVREEDDAKVTRKLHQHLKQQRRRKRISPELIEKDTLNGDNECLRPVLENPLSFENDATNVDSGDNSVESLKTDLVISDESEKGNPSIDGTPKRPLDSENGEVNHKRCRTVIIDSDDEVQVLDKSISHGAIFQGNGQGSPLQVKKVVDVIDVDILPSPFRTVKLEEFHCTACSGVLESTEVHKHPLLDVIVCENCKHSIDEKDPLSDTYCVWCAKSVDLVTCKSCKLLFCGKCLTTNFGEECSSEAKSSGWQCCCCLPILLHRFNLECQKAFEDRQPSDFESNSEVSDAEIEVSISEKKRQKKRIRRILDDAELGEETKQKIALEKARQEHLKLMQIQSASKSWNNHILSIRGDCRKDATVDILGDATEGFIVNIAREEDEEPVRIPPSISPKLKPHQIAGIRFMWENVIQSVRKVQSGDKGLGCILAHTMGLGKTFQVISFLYTALRVVDLGLRTALVVTPVNVLHNWRHEFMKWRPPEYSHLRVLMLEDVGREKRAHLLAKWRGKGGVLLIGYAAFRNLSLGRHQKDKDAACEISHALQDGADILVCDEAHMIKNTKADITQALKQVKTQRRIALTGSPLQNNLMEYYCMVDFVREGFLGSSHEFHNRFQNPIENGQHTNSTTQDVKIMNQRSHILYEQLKGFVQRMDMNVVKKDLPPKTVFVITVKLSSLQKKLYKKFLEVHGFTGDKVSSEKTIRRSSFFAGYQVLAQIWNHPGLLQMAKEHKDHFRREDAVENFLVDENSIDDNKECNELLNGEKQGRSDNLSKKSESILSNEEINWWKDLFSEKIYKEVDYSGKMVLLRDILTMSSEVCDKALVFSQSLGTLDIIEKFLAKLPRKEKQGKYWKQGKDWYRLDGRTDGSERQKLVERFNEATNTRVKCMLISTRAGSLGINLHAANRVIVVDGSWNPTHDLQAIYRVWRYGQTKPVYAYRLMAHGTMEEKIYKRQVTKEGLAARVVDRQQIHRTMSKEEILHLFDFGDDEDTDLSDQSQHNLVIGSQDKTVDAGCPKELKSTPLSHGVSSSDKIMESLLSRHYPSWIASYHEHETLLQENEDERLSKEEQDMAWQTYQRSLEWEDVQKVTLDEFDRKPAPSCSPSEDGVPQQTKSSLRSHPVQQRKCSNLSHLLTLRFKNTKAGTSTVCDECLQEISWESLNRDGKIR